jgi:hypothetical protein
MEATWQSYKNAHSRKALYPPACRSAARDTPPRPKPLTPGKAAQDWEYDIERDIRDRRVDPPAIDNITTVREASAGQVKN